MSDRPPQENETNVSEPDSQPAAASAAAPEAKAECPEIQIRIFGRTDVGQVREHNEDNFILADLTRGIRGETLNGSQDTLGKRGTLFGVCDGMGGAAAGEVASQLAVDTIYELMSGGESPRDRDELAGRLIRSIEVAGQRIFAESRANRARQGMGTTATIAALLDDHLFLGQVGDSRAYLLRDSRLVQVTRDQSLVNQLIEAGQLTEEEAETFEHNNIILQALGTNNTVDVDLTYVKLRRGDTLLICSDGLNGVRPDEIREVLVGMDNPEESCRVLIDRANECGGHDNITVVVVRFEGSGLEPSSPADTEALRYQKYALPDRQPMSDGTGRMSGAPLIEYHELDRAALGDVDVHSGRGDAISIPTERPARSLLLLIALGVVLVAALAYFFGR